jgi:hypothetical protein
MKDQRAMLGPGPWSRHCERFRKRWVLDLFSLTDTYVYLHPETDVAECD